MFDSVFGFFGDIQEVVLAVIGGMFSAISEPLSVSDDLLWLLAGLLAVLLFVQL